MKKAKIASVFLIIGFFACMVLPAQAKSADTSSVVQSSAGAQPVLESATALVADASSGQIYYQKGMHNRMYPASITKILTGLISVENASPSDVVTVPEDVAQVEKKDYANIALIPGDTITLSQLEYTMFLASANDSAIAIADHVGGSLSGFVSMMNKKAVSLGAKDSHFSTPNGLPDPNNYTSAYDMALITRAAVQNATLMQYFGARSFKLEPSGLRKEAATFTTLHKMMKKTIYYDADVVAGKTGWETMSGNTLVTVAKKNGRTLIAVVMNGANSSAVYGDTRQLLNYAAAQPASASAARLETPQVKTADSAAKAKTEYAQKITTSTDAENNKLIHLAEMLAVTSLGLLICTVVALVCWRVRRRGFLD